MGSCDIRVQGTRVLKSLVLDAHSRAAVEAIQSLARRGVQVDAAAENDSIAFRSKRLWRHLRQPFAAQTDLFLKWLTDLDRESDYSLIVPATEGSLRHFLALPESNRLRQKAVLSSNSAMQIALDKSLTIKLASKLCIPIPETSLIIPGEDVPNCDSYPVVLKPVSSQVSEAGVVKLLQSRIVQNEFERREALYDMLPKSAVLQQELVSGYGVGVEMLYRRGKSIWQFSHKRLHEGSGLPGLGSGSSYRQSIRPNQELLGHSTRLLDALEWHGVAMVEYKVAEDGRFWLMEINPRLWGSLALAIDSGVDFPYGLLCIATGREVPPPTPYKIGYSTRLLSKDLDWIRNRFFYHPDVYVGLEVLKLLRPIIGRESWDYFDWGDLSVTAADFDLFVSEKFQAAREKIAKFPKRRAAKRLHAANLRGFLASERRPRRVLFLCHGNICRSPTAELLMRRRCPDLEVKSAGFHPREGRPSPEHVQKLATTLSIDLSNSLSKRVSAELVLDSDVVFLHDMRNYDYFCHEFPQDKNKILFLGLFSDPPLMEIKDPYDFDISATRRVTRQISAAIDSVGKKLFDTPFGHS